MRKNRILTILLVLYLLANVVMTFSSCTLSPNKYQSVDFRSDLPRQTVQRLQSEKQKISEQCKTHGGWVLDDSFTGVTTGYLWTCFGKSRWLPEGKDYRIGEVKRGLFGILFKKEEEALYDETGAFLWTDKKINVVGGLLWYSRAAHFMDMEKRNTYRLEVRLFMGLLNFYKTNETKELRLLTVPVWIGKGKKK